MDDVHLADIFLKHTHSPHLCPSVYQTDRAHQSVLLLLGPSLFSQLTLSISPLAS
jgi:hypothetical protein